jgi:hypothetical protein
MDMARPIEGIPPFKGKAAKWLADYLERTEPDPKKRERREAKDAELLARVKESPSIAQSADL